MDSYDILPAKMPAWEDYKKGTKNRGALALDLFVVHSKPAASPETLQATLPDHLAYQAKLESQGKLVFAGPSSDVCGDLMQGTSMIVYRAEGFDAAKALYENDPMHVTGARTFPIGKWLVNEGSFVLSVGLSGQTVEPS